MKSSIKNSQFSMRLAFLHNPYSKEIIDFKKDIPELKEPKFIFLRIHIEPSVKKYWRAKEQIICDEASAIANAEERGLVKGMTGRIKQRIHKGIMEGIVEEMEGDRQL